MIGIRRLLWKAGLVHRLDESGVHEFRRKLWRLGVVEGSEGFRVWTASDGQSTHFEIGEKSATIDSEWWGGDRHLRLVRASLGHWDPPHDGEPLTDVERDRIVARVVAALSWEGIGAQVD